MKCVSLFAGIGGFDLALTRLGHEIVYANEWDKYAAQTYEKNFKTKPDTRSITTVPETEIPNHRLLVAGFPCQAFSIAGKRGGFEDTRGTLFFEIARILKYQRPSYLLLENVKGLLSHDNGRTFETIMRTLTELGYELQWQVLNSKDFGVPQNRERVFIIGHYFTRVVSRPKVFPIRQSNQAPNGHEKQRFGIYSGAIDSNYHKGADGKRTLIYVGSVGKPRIESQKHLSRAHKQPARVYDPIRLSPTLSVQETQGRYNITQGGSVRRLTPTECERLQGFPDGWTEGVSDTQRYKQLGNAVTVNVVEEIVKRLGIPSR